jgi:hypothetical protein
MFAYRIGFPYALARAGGWFQLRCVADGRCELTEEVHFGYQWPVVAAVTDPLLRGALPIDEFRRHMREEHANLGALLGSA